MFLVEGSKYIVSTMFLVKGSKYIGKHYVFGKRQ